MKGLPPKKQSSVRSNFKNTFEPFPADEKSKQRWKKSDWQIHKKKQSVYQSPIPSISEDPNEEEKGGDSEMKTIFDVIFIGNVQDGEAEGEEENQLTAAATSALFSLKADRGSLEARYQIWGTEKKKYTNTEI